MLVLSWKIRDVFEGKHEIKRGDLGLRELRLLGLATRDVLHHISDRSVDVVHHICAVEQRAGKEAGKQEGMKKECICITEAQSSLREGTGSRIRLVRAL